ncbi:hypothetical protein GCM10010495_06460 [Kitasatospora herbaricolor]|uniref:hypothetical protein n=1 Tax=Kitasatospora herbaricolor TaxID=68217 RepID=UPI00174ADDF3|nr:hypothetical protein [Kitasatospora herbaricolor]MDQ0312113.1 hypothetical protein [Kitasatospora herbaricolor]GGU98365.1 hypothetical protein GCM10010495_06460 [Kitasatospora herbaricolor]
MRSLFKKASSIAAVAASMASLSIAGASTAHADSQYGCQYPYVCIYAGGTVNGSIIGMYRDVTSGYQNTSRTNVAVLNTRNDDTVWLRYVSGGTTYYTCLEPATSIYNGASIYATLTGIRISDSPTC